MTYQALTLHIREMLARHKPLVIAIDGPCGSGKTSLAKRLQGAFLDCAIIHVDDFFLQPHQRSPQRLTEPGGNMDRERLAEEVLSKLRLASPFPYHAYDCQENKLKSVSFEPASLVLVEGSYCLHPDLWQFYDLRIFLEVDPDTQLQRLSRRVPAALMTRFLEEWIPLENAYFQHFRIKENSDLKLSL